MTTPNPDQAEQCPQWMKDAARQSREKIWNLLHAVYDDPCRNLVEGEVERLIETFIARHHAAHCREGERAAKDQTEAKLLEMVGDALDGINITARLYNISEKHILFGKSRRLDEWYEETARRLSE